MRSHALAVTATALLITPALAGCATATTDAAPAPTVTVTATATVTATPEPAVVPRSPDEALTELDAWEICYGATSTAIDDYTLYPYHDDAVTDLGDGTFDVRVPVAPTSGEGYGAESICLVSGTVAQPTIDFRGFRDFG